MDTTIILRDLNVFVIDDDNATLDDTTVWILTADTYAIGHGDLDNRTELVGVYASLDALARNLPLKMAHPSSRIYNPIATQAVVVS
jgi:hypothetical protein